MKLVAYGWLVAQLAGSPALIVDATLNEDRGGYYVLGDDLTLLARPETNVAAWLEAHTGERVILMLRVRPHGK